MKSDAPLKTTYADILPPLSTEELEKLEASIKAEGVRVPILVDEDGEIIDGKHRYQINPLAPRQLISGLKTAPQKKAAAIRFNVDRRHLSAEQKDELQKKQRDIAVELRKEMDDVGAPLWSQEQIGMMLGFSRESVKKWLSEGSGGTGTKASQKGKESRNRAARTKIWPEDAEKILKLARRGVPRGQIAADFGVTERRINQIVKRAQQLDDAKRQAEADAKAVDDGSCEGMVVAGDFREKGAIIKDASVDLIFTDPPYDRKGVPLYADLAAFADRVLVPGGSLIAFCGQYALPEVMNMLSEHLTFWWMLAVLHTRGNKSFPGRFVHIGWKPMLWFVKGKTRAGRNMVRDVIARAEGDGLDFDHGNKAVYHKWAQGEREANYYIDKLSRKGSLIVDPFLGGGTTGAATVRLARRFVGFEVDAMVARRAAGRIAKAGAK